MLGLLLLFVGVLAGVVVGLVTAPVFWRTGYGFVPYGHVLTVEWAGERTFLVLGHVLVCAACFVIAAGLALLWGSLGGGKWTGFAVFGLVLTAAWAGFVARPLAAGLAEPLAPRLGPLVLLLRSRIRRRPRRPLDAIPVATVVG